MFARLCQFWWFLFGVVFAVVSAFSFNELRAQNSQDWSPFWSTATLPTAAGATAATSVGSQVFFTNGTNVDIYNTSTSTWSTATLPTAAGATAATSAGNDAFFTNGSNLDIYNTSTSTWSSSTLPSGLGSPAATSVGSQAFFAGDQNSNVVDIYDASAGTWSTASLSLTRYGLAAASAGNQVFFGGGYNIVGPTYAPSSVVDIYNTSTSTWSTASLSQTRYDLAAASAGGDVLFAGGITIGGYGDVLSNVVDIYNTSAGTWSTASLSVARYGLAAAPAGGDVFFAGGYSQGNPGYARSNVVDIYNTSTNKWSSAAALSGSGDSVAASAGNQVFFAGGYNSSGNSVVDIYTFQNYPYISSTTAFTLVGNTTVAGQMQLSGGSLGLATYNLTIGSMAGSAPINLGSGVLTTGSDNTSTTYSGAITGNGSLVKTGGGLLTLFGSNTYSGGTTVSGGTVAIDNGGSRGSITGNVTDNAVLAFSRSDVYTFAGNVTGLGSVVMNGAGTLVLTGAVSPGTIAVNQGQIVASSGSIDPGNLTISAGGRFTNNSGNLYVINLTNSGTFISGGQVSGNFMNQSSGDVRIAAAQMLYLQNSGSQSNSGLVEVLGSGASQAQFESAGPFTNASGGGTGMIAGQYATLHFDGGLTNQAALAFSYGVNNVFGTVANSPSGNITIAGGAGVTFYGDVVQNGTLVVSTVGSTHSSAVFLGAFSGSGGFTGGGDVFFEGDLRPSDPVKVTFGGNAYLESTTNTLMQLAGPIAGSQYDQISVTGQLNLAGALDVELLDGFEPQMGESFQLFDGQLSGTFSQVCLPALSNAEQWNTNNLYTTGTISVVPEPSTLALLAAGAIGLIGYGLRRRRVATRTGKLLSGVSSIGVNLNPRSPGRQVGGKAGLALNCRVRLL